MDYRKVILSTATLSLGVSANAGAVDINNNQSDYIKLAAIIPVAELDAGVKLNAQKFTPAEIVEKKCIAQGYEYGLTCPPAGEETLCVTERCEPSGAGYDYVKCTCYCNGENTCKEMGYTEPSCGSGYLEAGTCPIDSDYKKCVANPCSGYNYSNSCPSGYESSGTCLSGTITKHKCTLTTAKQCTDAGYSSSTTSCSGYNKISTCPYNSTYKKCVAMTAQEKCTKDGYVYNKTCSGYYKPANCSYDGNYKKCVAMTAQEKCTKDGYVYNKTCSGYYKPANCSYDSSYKKCVAMTAGEKCVKDGYSSSTTSCSSGYKLSNCPYSTSYKKCVTMSTSEKCAAEGYYSSTTSCSGYNKLANCPYSSSYKKCVAMSSAEKCVKDGYASGRTCTAGHPTHQKRSACPYVSTYYKCVSMTAQEMCNNDGYYKTSCSSGYALTNKCSHGNYYLTCEKTAATRCTEAGYVSPAPTCAEPFKSFMGPIEMLELCSYSSSYSKCVPHPCAGYDFESCALGATATGPATHPDCAGKYKCSMSTNAQWCLDNGYFYKQLECSITSEEETCLKDTRFIKCNPISCLESCEKLYAGDTNAIRCCQTGLGINCNTYIQCDLGPESLGGGECPTSYSSTANNSWCSENGYRSNYACSFGQSSIPCPCQNSKNYNKCSGEAEEMLF